MYWSIPERPPRVNRITGKCSRYPCSKKLRSSWFWPIVSYTVIYTYCMITSDVQSVSGQSQSNGWGSLVYWNLSLKFNNWEIRTFETTEHLMFLCYLPMKMKIHEHGVLIMTLTSFHENKKKDQNFQQIGGGGGPTMKCENLLTQARCAGHPSGPYPTSGTRPNDPLGVVEPVEGLSLLSFSRNASAF